MRNKYIEQFEQSQINAKEVPDFRAGDTLKLAIHIKEGDKSRIQNFEGICIARRGSGVGETFMVRKIGANGVGVERIFPIYSDSLESITVVRKGKVRRARLFYIRKLRGKAARIRELKK
ncbi:50S ribosomal protein L19 [Campylobacter canadensis]|uniref:Large ribosomal subunit protein bL19 n=1 Tax=Campylobacter canadensis TaxID=449520 RepID=A0ABS7WU91_9BACT|nr:50S ribosomal protein L19 [Campylobacter canadensis]MBZ7987489.1 50S ribosomal protein L19 [Campylobacter canadensis]MBZ7994832.1 50S ribosomal protein L19 [Campylobacter canadensis]MBZ7996383.1 50S ribosomal protein L19 [Campylobacter canadensis]MBZ7998417.1 50S ribosomal protein L19 [Campylobacter canadensis]MBZ8000131.1 50S ribosomal protein L19 [Campylobacter canadensis]